MKWESSLTPDSAESPSLAPAAYYSGSPPVTPAAYPAPADPVSLEHLLKDKQLLALLVRNLLGSEEFERAMEARHTSSQEQVNSAVTDALSKLNLEFNKVVS